MLDWYVCDNCCCESGRPLLTVYYLCVITSIKFKRRMDGNTSSDDDGYLCDDDDYTWVQRFTKLKGHELLLEVPHEYISNDFNTENLQDLFPNFTELRDIILDQCPNSADSSTDDTRNAAQLYTLIH